jgi:predicted ATPase/DNA-binding CsgD family transcriptional regulator
MAQWTARGEGGKRAVQRRGLRRSPPRAGRSAAHPRPRPSNHNLPGQLTSFIGRDPEIAEVQHRIPHTRLLTLSGSGGCGKTRLALRVAADSMGSFPDGVWFVDLAPLADPALVPAAVAAALNVAEHPGKTLTETLERYLQAKRLLLILDNCEHVLSGAADLTVTLLQSAPNLTVLATSREPLGVAGEAVWRVPPLSLPDATAVPHPESLMSFDAVRLFAERAAFSEPGFTLTKENAAGVVRICWLLDGIPLAIEFAAAQVKALSVQQIAARLDERFRLLAGPRRTALLHHQSLRAALDWSYDLLSQKERAVFRRLSVFAGGWGLEAAEAVCPGREVNGNEILHLLTQLVDKSLVIAETSSDEARYRMLETTRQYAQARLLESGEEAETRTRHCNWYLELAERAEQWIRGPEETAWLNRMEAEHDNLRAALGWSAAGGQDGETALRLATAVLPLWESHTHWSEGRERLEAVLAGTRDKSRVRPKALYGAAILAWYHRDHDRAAALFEESLALAQELGDQGAVGRALYGCGLVPMYRGEFAKATALFERSLEISRRIEDKSFSARILAQMGVAARRKGDYAKSMSWSEEGLAMSRAVGAPGGIGYTLRLTGHAVRLLGQLGRAAALYRESLTLFETTGDKWVATECIEGLALIAAAEGEFDRAARLFGIAAGARETFGITISRPGPQDQWRLETRTRERLGPDAFAAAWDDGRAMTLERGIEYALRTKAQERDTAAGGLRPKSGAVNDGSPLTPREHEIAVLIARGLSNREIASQLDLAKRTAETHVQNILNKLNVNSRAGIAAWAVEHGFHSARPD